MAIIKRVLFDVDSPSREQISRSLKFHKEEQSKFKNGIFHPGGFLKPCEGCGKEEFKPELYFGQVFCIDCVQKWKAGEK